jgi:bifunctional UDP-N-acetylglucosamine pyrophosphorylase / glucosamine-1-phosphate N-acetyltransferase
MMSSPREPIPSSRSSEFAIAIMAAGKGTRLKSKRPKVLHEVGGRPLLAHVIAAAAKVVSPDRIFVIVGHEAERVREAVRESGVQFILQAEQKGTGHAIQCGREALSKYKDLLVLSGDVPLIRPETIVRIRDLHLKQRAAMTILTTEPPDPTGYGRVIRKSRSSAEVKAIIEQKALPKKFLDAPEINSGIYAFAAKPLFRDIDKLKTNNVHGEYYLTDMAALLVKAKEKVIAVKAESAEEVLGANTIPELASLDTALRMQKCRELMLKGVTIFRPETCVIDPDVNVGPDTIIEPFVQLLGNTRIGEDCRVRSFSVITNSQIANGVLVRNGCIIDGSRIASGVLLGPYCHVRRETDLAEGVHVGNFVETKKAKLGRGSKANHLTYLGDAEIGSGVNVGAGTITCNYDGVNKHRTVIEDDVFVGSDSTLVAPVKLGRGSYVGAASCITDDVPADALAIGRGRQVIKDGWAREKRKQKS